MTEYVTVWKDHEPTKLRWGVPVVRCRDCRHMGYGSWGTERPEVCRRGASMVLVEPDGFCAWGVRR